METTQFLKIFKTFLLDKDDSLNFNGIIIIPRFTQDKVIIDYENPSDLSFNRFCIVDTVYGQLEIFCKMFGLIVHDYYKLIDINISRNNGIYLNNTDRNNISKIINEINKTKKHILDGGAIDVLLEFESNNFEIMGEPENITIEVVASIEDCSDYDELSYWYYEGSDYNSDSYHIMLPVVDYISSNPLLFNIDYMYTNVNIVLSNIESYQDWSNRED